MSNNYLEKKNCFNLLPVVSPIPLSDNVGDEVSYRQV